MHNTLSEVIQILKRITDNKFNEHEDTHLINDIGLTSLEMMLFICELEKNFNCKIEVTDVIRWQTIGDVVFYVANNTKGE